jgi:hypothetical protein
MFNTSTVLIYGGWYLSMSGTIIYCLKRTTYTYVISKTIAIRPVCKGV